MQYDEFIGKVQSRARLASNGEAVRATRATLEVLAERLFAGEAENLAAQLPGEIAYYIRQVDKSERFGLDDFFGRVSEHEGVDLPEAIHHARAVVSVLNEAVSKGEIDDIRAQLPVEFNPLFESGSEGEMARKN